MAAAAAVINGAIPAARRNTFFTGTPEIYFAKAIDNSRLVKVEDPRRKREMKNLTEMNRALHLEDASLRDPERIDVMARRMGLVPPEPGQVMRMDSAAAESNTPVMARVEPGMVLAG